ncbi:hypothetical protein FS837_007171, partial [Tulasnella sp. UAMH 9824]
MIAPALFTTLSLAALAASAPTKRNNNQYYAQALILGNGIEGHLQFWGSPDGSPTKVTFQGSGLYDSDLQPYLYHIHTNPVGQERNCTV